MRSRRIEGRIVLIIDAEAYQLNEIAEVAWTLCTGEKTFDQIVAQISQHYDVDQSRVRADFLELFSELEAMGAIIVST